ncbi:hypothetical protein CKAN_00405100 [Cinnamomum micranthum f. kanehirae]|uniref:Uncharacterized protein n=1 Tax=Cinnamomum micranthum f. kanehirae TaxID=337451 RepID=A0A3S4NDC4_9MAGN|nr:hypothetical protein CKAN_00405100 [Cinnamomum micranthum f. kanehirae]
MSISPTGANLNPGAKTCKTHKISLRPCMHKLDNENQSQIQSIEFKINLDRRHCEDLILQYLEGQREDCVVRQANQLTIFMTVNNTIPIPIRDLGFGVVEHEPLLNSTPSSTLAIVHTKDPSVFVHVPYLKQAENQPVMN